MGVNIANLIAGALLGGIAIAPPPAAGGAVMYCNVYGCTSSPYFRPPIVPAGPPVVFTPPPLAIPPARPQVYAPAPPLDPPRPRAEPPTPPPPPHAIPPAAPTKTERREQAAIEQDIMAFCDAHPDEQFCGRLGEWLRTHPQPKGRR